MKFLSIVSTVALFLCATFSFAQTTPTSSSGISFAIDGQAVGINLNKQWTMATDSVETLSVVSSPRLGTFYAEGHQVLTPSGTFSAYLGGLKWIPRLDDLIAKTTLPPSTFQFYVHAAPGIVRTAAGANKLGGIAGGGLDYDPLGNAHFTVNVFRVDYLNAPGFGGGPNGFMVSSGIAVYFGKTTN